MVMKMAVARVVHRSAQRPQAVADAAVNVGEQVVDVPVPQI